MKKLLTYILCSVFLLASLSGCGEQKQPASNNGTTEVVVTEAPEVTEAPVVTAEPVVTEAPTEAPEETEVPTEEPEVINIADISSTELVSNMKLGWNLGNTLDATGGIALDSERAWGNPETTQEMIDAVLDQGINVIRIPVTWDNHFGEGPDYIIHDIWLDRVQEVVDYAYNRGAYVILNMHHEEWHFPSEENKEEASEILRVLWTQIAEHFKNYDEHLIFEGLNEPRKKGTNVEWNGGDEEGRAVVNHFMQVFVDTVRATGGNNEYRHLMICGYAASSSTIALESIELPDDDKLIVSVHAYTPYNFALNTKGTSVWKAGIDNKDIDAVLKDIKEIFLDEGVPVIIGEFGAMNKENEYERAEWASYYVSAAKEIGVPCIWWDNNTFTGAGENFGLLDRRTLTFPYPYLLEALQEAAGIEVE